MRIVKSRWMCAALGVAFVMGACGLAVWAQTQPQTGTSAPAAAPVKVDPNDILKAIPKDAAAFVAVRNLKELNDDIASLARTLGFVMGPNGMFPMPLDWLKEMAMVRGGVNDYGSLAFVVLDSRDVGAMAGISSRSVLLISSTDGAALIESLGGQKVEDLFAVTVMGTPMYAAVKGQHVAAAQSAETLKDFLRAKGPGVIEVMSEDRVQAFATQDLAGWVNLKGFSDQIRQELNDTLAGFMMMMNPAAATEAEEVGKNLDKFVTETQELAFAVSMDGRGVQLSGYVSAVPGSEMADQLKAVLPADGPLLMGLPDEPTIFAMGMTMAGEQ